MTIKAKLTAMRSSLDKMMERANELADSEKDDISEKYGEVATGLQSIMDAVDETLGIYDEYPDCG